MSLRGLWPVLAIAAVALIPTWSFLFGGKVPAPVDQAHQFAPWNAQVPPSEWDALQLDGALQFLPWRHFMLDAMRNGFVPLWNPYTFGGTPFLANSQSAPLYPLHWLWPFDAESLLSFSAWLHLVIAGLGVFLLCKRLGSDDKGGVIAGCAVALSAFMIGWLQLPSVQMTAAWIPWCLLGVFRAFDEPSCKSVGKLALSIGLMLLAGHLQIAAFGLLAVAVAGLWLLAFERNAKGFALVAAGGLLGSMLAAPQVLPTLENARNGHRASSASEEGWNAYRSQAVKPGMLVTLFDPAHFGQPQWGEGLTGYWLGIKEPGRNYAESAWFIGPAIVPLMFFALWQLRRNVRAWLLVFLCAISVAIATGTVFAKAAYFLLPGWSSTGSPGRIAILFAACASVLAGLCFRSQEDKVGPWRTGAVLALLVGVAGLLWAHFAYDPTPFSYYGTPPKTLGLALVLTLPVLIAIAAMGYSRKWTGMAAAAIFAAQIALPSVVHHDLNPGSERGRYIEPFAELEHLRGKKVAVVNENWSLFGAAAGVTAPPNSLLCYGITEVGGYDSLIPARIKQQLDEINGKDSAPAENGNMLFVKPGFDPEKLGALGVDYVLAGYRLDLPLEHDMGNWRLYRLPGPPPESVVVSSKFNEKTLRWGDRRDEARDWLNSPEADGWEMSLLSLDFEKQTVTTVYRPHSYRLGFLLALVGISAIVALCYTRERK